MGTSFGMELLCNGTGAAAAVAGVDLPLQVKERENARLRRSDRATNHNNQPAAVHLSCSSVMCKPMHAGEYAELYHATTARSCSVSLLDCIDSQQVMMGAGVQRKVWLWTDTDKQ